jgi:flagella basal body P-ring formation protein FlgA
MEVTQKMNGRPLSKAKQVRILVALTILAWATQTLLHQWGYGQVIGSTDLSAAQPVSAQAEAERFVPPSALMARAGTLELRGEATILGTSITLKQLCRWSDADANAFTSVADLVIDHIDKGNAYKTISLDALRKTLAEAKVNLAFIRFAGATSCTVTRGDVSGGDRAALEQWIEEKTGTAPKQTVSAPTTAPTPHATPVLAALELADHGADSSPVRALRDQLLTDLSQRLNVPVENLQVNFDPKDAHLLNLAEPGFHFDIQARRVRDLGQVNWNVSILSGGSQQKVSVTAEARAWQDQMVTTRSVPFGSIIREQDVTDRRVLIDHLDDTPVLTKEQVVGQQAARDLSADMVMTARLVQAVPLVKTGQYVTVTLNQGGVRVKTVAKAMESGSFGQTVRVKNEETKDVFEVTMVGPQTATMGPAADEAGR